MSSSTRRSFLRNSLTASAAVAATLKGSTLARAAGANERIRIGVVGCGVRSSWHCKKFILEASAKYPAEVIAVCDVWRQQREALAKLVKDKYKTDPKLHVDYRELLANKDVDAVIIATPDHQHCGQLIDAVQAGKDVYIEKPIAMGLDELNKAYDAVKASKSVVQHGTQGRSCSGAATAREFIRSGKLGKVVRIEESRSMYRPYWNGGRGPKTEADTDWKGFLYNRTPRPFDADQHGAWMGYRDFSTGPVGGWMSHFTDLLHYITGCGFPRTAVCHGGIYAPTSDPRRTCPDTVTAIMEYAEGFTTLFTTHFGNAANDYIYYFGEKGTMTTGAPDGWPNGIEPKVCGNGSDHPEKIKSKDWEALPNNLLEDHWSNWLRCIRERKTPSADMEAGYMHGIAVLMADIAMTTGRKTTFDPKTREIRTA